MKKFLVISFDADEQQWFYDCVMADSEDKAAELICKIRPYVLDADAISLSELKMMPTRLSKQALKFRQEMMPKIAEESGLAPEDLEGL